MLIGKLFQNLSLKLKYITLTSKLKYKKKNLNRISMH